MNVLDQCLMRTLLFTTKVGSRYGEHRNKLDTTRSWTPISVPTYMALAPDDGFRLTVDYKVTVEVEQGVCKTAEYPENNLYYAINLVLY